MQVLKHRAEELPPPIQMCDAAVRRATCRTRCRQSWRTAWPARGGGSSMSTTASPRSCRHLLESLAVVYRNDAEASEGTSAIAGGRVCNSIRRRAGRRCRRLARLVGAAAWREAYRTQFGPRRRDRLHAEALGKADTVLAAGRCPAGQQPVRACVERRRSCIARTPCSTRPRMGPRIGDLFISLIYTCQLNEPNPFDYLTELQQHPTRLGGVPRAMDAMELPRGADLSAADDSDRLCTRRPPWTRGNDRRN